MAMHMNELGRAAGRFPRASLQIAADAQTLSIDTQTIIISPGTGNWTATLPDPATSGQRLAIICKATGAGDVDVSGAFFASAGDNTVVTLAADESVYLISDDDGSGGFHWVPVGATGTPVYA